MIVVVVMCKVYLVQTGSLITSLKQLVVVVIVSFFFFFLTIFCKLGPINK